MIVTPWFVYIHLHKTGGTFVNESLLQYIPGAELVGYHLPRRLIPKAAQDRPILGFVRSPWSYYVSWYHFQFTRPIGNPLFNIASDYRRRGFKATVRNLVELSERPDLLDEILQLLPNVYVNRGINLPRFALETIRGTRQGFFSFLHNYMYGGEGASLHIGRNEHLRNDLLRFLEQKQVPVSFELKQHILGHERSNASEHEAYTQYYDTDLRDLIAERDSSLIRLYEYQFGDP